MHCVCVCVFCVCAHSPWIKENYLANCLSLFPFFLFSSQVNNAVQITNGFVAHHITAELNTKKNKKCQKETVSGWNTQMRFWAKKPLLWRANGCFCFTLIPFYSVVRHLIRQKMRQPNIEVSKSIPEKMPNKKQKPVVRTLTMRAIRVAMKLRS